MNNAPLGLYVHIPFCSALCNYCDFAKTANYGKVHVKEYLDVLLTQLIQWKNILGPEKKFTSVFFGGGTPGLFAKEYDSLMGVIHEMSAQGAEVTLEANPDNVSLENIQTWKSLGINRLSVGVQTFDEKGLKDLTRQHSIHKALSALELASKNFPKSNGDLIYGWNGQTLESWRRDLEMMVSTGVDHVSLYALTYEGHTPFARAERRGIRHAMPGDDLAERYKIASEFLKDRNFVHEEVSNWAKEGTSCEHNWLYWRANYYVAIGAGAHGFLDDGTPIGLRYHYPSDFRELIRRQNSRAIDASQRSYSDLVVAQGGAIDRDRDLEAWKLEYVGCGLRCQDGVNLEKLSQIGFTFRPSATLQRATAEGYLFQEGSELRLIKEEWFRETAWSLEVCESLVKAGS